MRGEVIIDPPHFHKFLTLPLIVASCQLTIFTKQNKNLQNEK